MEYRGYTPNEVKKDKCKNMFFIILLIFPMLLGLFLIFGEIVELLSINVDDVSTISYKSMSEGEEYYFDELVLLDSYAFNGNATIGYAVNNFYIVSFLDRDGKRVYTSLQIEGYSDFNEKCEAYVEDENLSVGDVILSGCFQGYKNSSTVSSYFQEAYDLYNVEMPGEMLDWSFWYDDAETMEEYHSDKASGSYIMFGIGAIYVIPCVIGIVILIRKRKELDQYIAEYNNGQYDL